MLLSTVALLPTPSLEMPSPVLSTRVLKATSPLARWLKAMPAGLSLMMLRMMVTLLEAPETEMPGLPAPVRVKPVTSACTTPSKVTGLPLPPASIVVSSAPLPTSRT